MNSPLVHIKRFVTGIIVGIASTLPGVSGGVLAVCLGIYERLITDLADIFHKIKSDFWFLLMVGSGVVVGMTMTAFGLKFILDEYLAISLFLFLGLIIGQIPEIYGFTEPEKSKPRVSHIAAFAFGVALMVCFMFLGTGKTADVGHDLVSYMLLGVVGLVVALSKIVPGLSGSAILLAMGLYKPMLDAITSLDFALLGTMLVGFVVGMLMFAKIVATLLEKHRRGTYFAILGFTTGSVIVILNTIYADISSVVDIVGGIVALVIGIWISTYINRFNNEKSEKTNLKETEQL